jgi:kojibiose phosphorylase
MPIYIDMKEYYSKYSNEDLWCIKEDGFDKEIQNIRESQFALGNGLIGCRGVLEENPLGASAGTYVAGVYDRITSQVAELVNFPNPLYLKFTIKGEKFGAVAMDIVNHKRVLNMRDGLLIRRTIYSDSKKRRYDYQSLRFVSMHNKNIGVMQIILTPLDDRAELELQTGIDVSVYNAGVMTEGNKRHFQIKELGREDNSGYLVVETLEKRQRVIYRSGIYYKIGSKKIYAPDDILRLGLKKGQKAIFTKIFYICACREDESEFRKDLKLSKTKFKRAFRCNFESLLKKHRQEWHKIWDMADVVIEGTSDIQKNLRFNIYHMLICAHCDDGFSSIGARTLSGEGYRGHIFWDSEIFLLPFYGHILPDVAKNMLLYRYRRLEQARIIAKTKGYKGAMFPWESAGMGEEEAPTWAKNLDGSIIKIKTDKLEHHITADIAYACRQYADISDDRDFMRNYGYEIILETARFWASRVEYNKKSAKFEIKNVIGPDEFHEHVDNNAYTNIMAKWNLLTGYKVYYEIKEKDHKGYKRLRAKLNLTDREVNKWKYIAPRIALNIRKDKVIEQFDGFFNKRYIEIVNFDENNIPRLPAGIKVRDYNKTQFVKQADVLMSLYLLSDIFRYKIKESNFWYYVNRTLHKSSLSASIHTLVAIDVGVLSRAYQFFNVALRADISNLHGNTCEGIHAASLGGVWQSVVNGFAGISRQNNILSINPRMPKTWRKIKCSLLWRKNLVRIEAKNTEVYIKVESKPRKKIKAKIFNRNRILNANKEYVFRRQKMLQPEGYY